MNYELCAHLGTCFKSDKLEVHFSQFLASHEVTVEFYNYLGGAITIPPWYFPT